MGESDRYQDYRKLRTRRFTLGQPGNALFALFAANVGAFFLILLFHVFTLYARQGQDNSDVSALHWFALPANLITLSERPWTLLTFMFAQGGGVNPVAVLFAMAASMLWLWTFAYILQDLSGNKYIFPIYIYGSLAAALFFLIAANSLPPLAPFKNQLFLYSAQFGTMAIAVAVTTLSPTYKIFKNIGNGIPIWLLTVLYAVVSFVYAGITSAAAIALLGAALAGYIFIFLLKKDKDISIWMHKLYNWCTGALSPGRMQEQNKVKEKIFYNTGGRQPFSKSSNVTQQRIDDILDKINQKGYQFLTDEEKAILKRASEEDI